MDLVALACQEVGLDLTEEIVEFKDVQVPNQDEWRHSSWQDDVSQEVWPLAWEEASHVKPGNESRVFLHKQLSFGGGTSSTVFTDHDGRQSTVSLQFTEQSSNSGVSPVTNLYSQRQANPNYLPRRSRPSQVSASIQGAPCRNLPELPPTSNPSKPKLRSEIHPVLEVPSLLIQPNPFQESNPFLHLFEDTRPGQTAFAFYVSDCWFSFSSSCIVPDYDQFYRQCQGWWVGLPTPYRRGYWTREVEHLQIKSGKLMPVNKKTRKKPSKNISRVVDGIEPKKSSPPKNKSTSPPKKMMKAFKNFLAKKRSKVEEEMVGATKREVRNELGKRWKALDTCGKEKYIEVTDEEVGDEDKENVDTQGVLTCHEQIDPNSEYDVTLDEDELGNNYEIKVEQPPSSIFLDDMNAIDAFLEAEDSNMIASANRNVEENAFKDVKTESTINMTLEEINQFAIGAKFFIEDGIAQHDPELSSPERNVIDLVSNLSV